MRIWRDIADRWLYGRHVLGDLTSLVYAEGRESLLKRSRATTELKMLDVKKKELELAVQRANALIALNGKVEKIKNTQLRELMRRTLLEHKALGNDPTLIPVDLKNTESSAPGPDDISY